jgi:hypothetical protein
MARHDRAEMAASPQRRGIGGQHPWPPARASGPQRRAQTRSCGQRTPFQLRSERVHAAGEYYSQMELGWPRYRIIAEAIRRTKDVGPISETIAGQLRMPQIADRHTASRNATTTSAARSPRTPVAGLSDRLIDPQAKSGSGFPFPCLARSAVPFIYPSITILLRQEVFCSCIRLR